MNPKTITLAAAVAVGFTLTGCSSAAPPAPAAVTVTQTVAASTPAATVTVEVKATPRPAVTKTVEVVVTPKPVAAQPKVTAKQKTVIPLEDSTNPNELELYDSLYAEDGTDTGPTTWMKYTAPDWSGGAPKWWKGRIDYYYDMGMCGSIKSILNTLPAYETDIRAIIVQEASYKGTCN